MRKKKANKKLVFIIETLANGGAERVTAHLANMFNNNEYDVHLLIINQSDNEYYVSDKITKHYLKTRKNNRLIRFFCRMMDINKMLDKINGTIIVSLSTPGTNTLLLPSLLATKRRVLLSERNDPNRYPKSNLLKMLRFINYSLANKVIFQTNEARSYFPNHIQKKGIVIPNPITQDLPEKYNGRRNKKIVNFCRIDEQKNLKLLIDACILLFKEYPDYRLELYGKGPLENELKGYVKECGFERYILFKGHIVNLHEQIVDSTMFVSSSDYEGISNSMLEALAMGMPTICTDCPIGGARMVIKSYFNGILVPVGDTVALFRAMKEIVENEDLRERLSINAMNVRQQFSVNSVFKEWNTIVNSYIR